MRAYLTQDDIPLTRIVFYVDEATAAQVAGPDTGRASAVDSADYVSPGATGQAWRAVGEIDATYGRLEASLTSGTGPWTNISAGSLADPSAVGTARTLYLRYVAHRWGTDVNPSMRFELGLYTRGKAAVDEA